MIAAHAATLLRSIIRLAVIYGCCVIVGLLTYHGGEILRLKEQRGRNAEMPADLVADLRKFGMTEQQVDRFAHLLSMKRR